MSVNLVDFLNQYTFKYTIESIGQEIEFKPITTGQMKNLLSYEDDSEETIEEVLDNILRECVVTEGFDIRNITIQDRFDLMIELRKKSKGNTYSFVVTCPECGTDSYNTVDLENLEAVPFPEKIDRWIKLSDDLSVEMFHLSRGEQEQAFEHVKNMEISESKKLVELTYHVFSVAMKRFRTPAGDVDDVPLEEKRRLLENLASDKYDLFTEWFNKNDYGIKFEYTMSCDKCGFKAEREIPATDFFV
jgi:rRNA maturation protein Nop10